MAAPIKNKMITLNKREYIIIPKVILEENNLTTGSKMQVFYGRNYACIIAIPDGIKISERMIERISLLVNEKLD